MADKLDLVFKKVVNRQYTNAAKNWYEENPGVSFKLKGSDVWIDNIPEIPPTSDSAVVKGYRLVNKLLLTKDITVNNNQCWYAQSAGHRITGFISPRFGQGYTARLFLAGGSEIATTHACGWFFDYESGNLTFDATPPVSAGGYEVAVYQYIGSTVDVLAEALEGSAWQDPVLSIVNEPTGTEVGGERYLISQTPTAASLFDGHAEAIAEFDGVNWKFSPSSNGKITYVISLDRLYVYDNNGGWAWSGIDSADLDYDNSGSDLNSISVKDALDELDALIKNHSLTFYVDSNNTSSYVQTGSINKPFKTLANAISVVPSGSSLQLSPGIYNGSGLNSSDNISILGSSVSNTFLQNDMTIGFDTTSNLTLENIYFNNSNTVVINNQCILKNVKCNGRLILNSNCSGYNVDVKSASPGDALVINGGDVTIDIITVSHVADHLSLKHVSGNLTLTTARISGNRNGAVAVSESGIINTNFTSIINNGTGKALIINNSASQNSPNQLIDTNHKGGIDTNAAYTIVEGVTGGNPTSTLPNDSNLIYRGGTQLRNDSTIIKTESGGVLIGKTINDSIDRVAQVVQFDSTHGFIVVDPCIDNIN